MAISIVARFRWGRVFVAGLLAYASAVVVITVIVTVYAFILAFQVRGAPDQSRIQGLADSLGASWGVVMVAAASFLGTLWAVRKETALPVLHGLLVGTVAGTVGVAFSGMNLLAFVELGIYSAAGMVAGLVAARRRRSSADSLPKRCLTSRQND